jgi:hypothetical protein
MDTALVTLILDFFNILNFELLLRNVPMPFSNCFAFHFKQIENLFLIIRQIQSASGMLDNSQKAKS